jgi:hypothetical protein
MIAPLTKIRPPTLAVEETRTEETSKKPGQTEMTRMNKHLPYLISIVFRFRVISVCPGFFPGFFPE